jgi:hypothetical protein
VICRAHCHGRGREQLIERADAISWLCRPGTTRIFGEAKSLRSLAQRTLRQ